MKGGHKELQTLESYLEHKVLEEHSGSDSIRGGNGQTAFQVGTLHIALYSQDRNGGEEEVLGQRKTGQNLPKMGLICEAH